MLPIRARLLAAPLLGAMLVACAGTPSPSPGSATLPPAPEASFVEGTVPDVLARDGRFGALLAVLALTESPQGPPGRETVTPVLELMTGPSWQHTLFAPTDASFAVLPPEVLEALLSDPNVRLSFVRFHISQRVWTVADLPASGTIETPAGLVEVSRDGDRIAVGDAVIVEVDVAASNGVIQVLDGFVWVPSD